MRDAIIAAILNEGAWLTWSMGLAFLLVFVLCAQQRRMLSDGAGVLRAMNAVAANVSLFVGSLIFWVSGQTFEQFRGIE